MKFKILYFIFLLFSVKYISQITFQSDIDDKTPKVNQPITMVFVLQVQGDDLEMQSPIKLPFFDNKKIEIIGSASERNADLNNGNLELTYFLRIKPKQTGKIKLGSALVQINGKMYKTEPFDINVAPEEINSNKNRDIAKSTTPKVKLNLEVKNKEVYEYQQTIAILKASSDNFGSLRNIEEVNLPKNEDIKLYQISNREQEIDNYGGVSSQILGIYLVSSKKSGNVEIPSVTATVQNANGFAKIASNKVSLNVKNLPKNAPKDFKNAVGDYSLEIVNHASGTMEVNKPINVEVKLKGTGNLKDVELPEILSTENYRVYTPHYSEKIKSGGQGFSGEVIADYLILPQKSGKFPIVMEGFSFFNPITKEYQTTEPEKIMLSVLTREEIEQGKNVVDRVWEQTNAAIDDVKIPEFSSEKPKTSSEDIGFPVWMLAFAVVFAGFFAYVVYRIMGGNTPKNSRQEVSRFGNVQHNHLEHENDINEHQGIDWEIHQSILKRLVTENNYADFFNAYDDLYKDLEKKIKYSNGQSIADYLADTKGNSFYEEFKYLNNRIEMEKFAPYHEDGMLEQLYQEIITLYSSIDK